MLHDTPESFSSYLTLSELLVPVFSGAAGILAVIEMYRTQSVQPDDPVELCQHSVQVAFDIVSAVPHVTRVEAHTDPVPGHQGLYL